MLRGFRNLSATALYLIRIHRELVGLRRAQERIAAAADFHNAHSFPLPAAPDARDPLVSVEFINEPFQAELMDIELRLTRATGQPPTEEEILNEWTLRHADLPPAVHG